MNIIEKESDIIVKTDNTTELVKFMEICDFINDYGVEKVVSILSNHKKMEKYKNFTIPIDTVE